MTMDIPDVVLAEVQRDSEGLPPEDGKIEFLGELFILPEQISFMPMLLFAKAAKSGLDTADMDGMSALYDMIHGCLDPADDARFDRLALAKRASDKQLMNFVTRIMEAVNARPTDPRSDSTSPERNISRKSKAPLPLQAAELRPVEEFLR
jgi:hypothetical protein